MSAEPEDALWTGMPVFVTGHTGFKGCWMSMMLHRLGAQVWGYALDPPTEPSLFETASVGRLLANDERGDIRDLAHLRRALTDSGAAIVFHLAAQPLVVPGYEDPVGTFETNTIGTMNVLEAARASPTVRAVVVVTTDKCYEIHGGSTAYRETDRVGGADPYSASKAAAEIVVGAYRSSYFVGPDTAAIASVRAGNVVGGGDWAAERLVPDCIRAYSAGAPVVLRYPRAVRPWQHVFEPLTGYLLLAEQLLSDAALSFEGAWNFGPDEGTDATVQQVAAAIAAEWGEGAEVQIDPASGRFTESAVLRLDSTKARSQLGWAPRWSTEQALRRAVRWYRAAADHADMVELSLAELDDYRAAR